MPFNVTNFSVSSPSQVTAGAVTALKLLDVQLSANNNTFDSGVFSNTYNDIQIIIEAAVTNSATLRLQFNADSNTDYAWSKFIDNAAPTTGVNDTKIDTLVLPGIQYQGLINLYSSNKGPSLRIFSWTGMRISATDTATAPNNFTGSATGKAAVFAPITQVTLTSSANQIAAGSRMLVYGLV